MKKETFIFPLIILSLFFLAGFVMAAGNCAPVGPPKLYSGDIYVNGTLLSGTYTINAMMSGVKVGSTNVVNGKYYRLPISPCANVVGDIIFSINGVEANEKGSYSGSQDDWGGEVNVLNLNLNILPPSNNPCGNGLINPGEECDGTNLAGRNITSCGQGFVGTISCGLTCEINYANCTQIKYCGDGTCNNGETCSTCSQDCGACSTGGNTGGSGGGKKTTTSGGGGSSSGTPTVITVSVNNTNTVNSGDASPESITASSNSNKNQETENSNGLFGVTGLAIGSFVKTPAGKGTVIGVLVVAILGVSFGISKNKKGNSRKKQKY
jgi:hypothetical protein